MSQLEWRVHKYHSATTADSRFAGHYAVVVDTGSSISARCVTHGGTLLRNDKCATLAEGQEWAEGVMLTSQPREDETDER